MTLDSTDILPTTTISRALSSVFYRNARTEFLSSIYSGRPRPDMDIAVKTVGSTSENYKLWAWAGGIPGAAGQFLIYNLYDIDAVEELETYQLDNGTGLSASDVAYLVGVFAENDYLPIAEQALNLDRLEAETGLRFTVVMSGDSRPESMDAAHVYPDQLRKGKSLHCLLPVRWIDVQDEEEVKLWEKAGNLLAAILMGDLNVRDRARKVRMGGVKADGRIQTLLRTGEPVDIGDAVAKLLVYADDNDIDVAGRIEALECARKAFLASRSRRKGVERDIFLRGHDAESTIRDATRLDALHDGIMDACIVTPEQRREIDSLPRWVFRREATDSSGRKAKSKGLRVTMLQSRTDDEPLDDDFSTLVLPESDETLAEVGAHLAPGAHRWVRCPYHHDRDASSKLKRGRGGRLHFSCYAGCGRYIDTPTSDGHTGGVRVLDLEPRQLLTESGHVDANKVRHLSIRYGKPRIIVVQTGTGSGKTHLASLAAGRILHAGGRVIGTSPTRSLTAGLSARLGVPYYEDVDGSIPGSCAVCIPSTPRVELTKFDPDTLEVASLAPDLLVVDEVEASVRSLLGSHLSDLQSLRAYEAMVTLVANSGQVLLLDADAGPATRKLLEVSGVENEVLWLRVEEEPRYSWVQHARYGSIRSEVLSWARDGLRVGVACASSAEARALAVVIKENTSARVGVVAGEHGAPARVTVDGEDVPDGLGDLAWVDDVDVLVWTWAMGTGVDLPGNWDRVAYIGNHGVPHTVPQVRQMIGRIRHLGNGEVHVYITNGPDPDRWKFDADEALKRWYRADAKERRLLDLPQTVVPLGKLQAGEATLDPDRWYFAQTLAAVFSSDVADGRRWLIRRLPSDAKLRDERYKVLADDEDPCPAEKAINEAISSAKNAQKRADATAVANAPKLTERQLDAIRRHGAQTREEALAAQRDAIENFYGPVFTDADEKGKADLVEHDSRGKRRHAIRQGVAAVACGVGDLEEQVLAELDKMEVESGRTPCPTRSSRRVLQGQVNALFMERLGIDLPRVQAGFRMSQIPSEHDSVSIDSQDLGQPSTELELDNELLGHVSRLMWRRREQLAVIGLNVSPDAADPDKHRRWMTRWLRGLGFTVTNSRKRVDGERVRVTTVSWRALSRDGAHYWRGLTTPSESSTSRGNALDRAKATVRRREDAAWKETWKVMTGVSWDEFVGGPTSVGEPGGGVAA